ncbi:DNA cytosine methyltransferase [Pseudomonas putida]|uniref:DNA (cytosine-5-)-methyltransferase n=1 Tax=Pseudomonas putida TaxID=303 RepID=A0A7Y7ZDV4_PSEPU|nr:DNA cytosine methyltransferase [Pseudomonas putida]NWC83126.1 DNA cytosine methyltransferase [Pseudomonas putida]
MSTQQKPQKLEFNTQYGLCLDDNDQAIIIDLFAGGGGPSTGLEIGLGRKVAVAINHNPKAISMHTVNHPHAKHHRNDIWGVDPLVAAMGRTVGWLHASPDCRHFSQALAGQARKEEIRDLSWVVIKYAGRLRKHNQGPWVISLENVKQIQQWGPMIAKRDKATGRVIKVDGTVADVGERVPRHEQFLIPDPKRKGRTWRHFLGELQRLGYAVNYWVERNCDYGDPTTRERLYMIATADGQKPVAPPKTHAAKPAKGQKPYRTAAECLDFSDMGTSIFTRKRPLAEKTLQRLAKGMVREVLDRDQPFTVPTTHDAAAAQRSGSMPASSVLTPFMTEHANGSRQRVFAADKALPTICAGVKGGHFSLVSPVLIQCNGGKNTTAAHSVLKSMSTITTKGSQQQLAAAHLVHLVDHLEAGAAKDSAGASNNDRAEEWSLNPEHLAGALRVSDFLMRYHHSAAHKAAANDSPATTMTTKERLALVTVWINGNPWVMVDLYQRMLRPRELYLAQGFPETYQIAHGHDGKPFTITEQTHMCGNSVSPGTMAAFSKVNDPWKYRLVNRQDCQEAA